MDGGTFSSHSDLFFSNFLHRGFAYGFSRSTVMLQGSILRRNRAASSLLVPCFELSPTSCDLSLIDSMFDDNSSDDDSPPCCFALRSSLFVQNSSISTTSWFAFALNTPVTIINNELPSLLLGSNSRLMATGCRVSATRYAHVGLSASTNASFSGLNAVGVLELRLVNSSSAMIQSVTSGVQITCNGRSFVSSTGPLQPSEGCIQSEIETPTISYETIFSGCSNREGVLKVFLAQVGNRSGGAIFSVSPAGAVQSVEYVVDGGSKVIDLFGQNFYLATHDLNAVNASVVVALTPSTCVFITTKTIRQFPSPPASSIQLLGASFAFAGAGFVSTFCRFHFLSAFELVSALT